MDLGSPTGLSHILFHVPNLKHYFTGRERVSSDQLTEDWRFDRVVMEAEGWRVTLEAVEDVRQLIEAVERRGGNVITHVGKLERSDGSPFDAQEANEPLSILTYFLSFARGYWVNPIFPVGFDADGKRCWERWQPWRADSWRYRPSWCDEHYGDNLALAFPGFVRRWLNPLWHEPTRLGVHWYIESNRGESDQEPVIILAQAALDMLAGTLLVEDQKKANEKDFDNPRVYPAHRKLREMLKWASIPTQLPASLTQLRGTGIIFGKQNDGPAAFTATRNWFGHPTKKNRTNIDKLNSQAITEAWTLGIWYLELFLLRLFDFQGPYSNRLTARFLGEVEAVPWSQP